MSDGSEERQCRICLDGPDAELGRLIRPCLCRGSISFVHVKCLHRWRKESSSESAFYSCPQCHYNYRFARTSALGIASNPLFIGALSIFLFTCIVYFASFIATFFMNGLDDHQRTESSFFFGSYYWISPTEVASNLVKMALRVLRDEDLIVDDRLFKTTFDTSPPGPQTPPAPPGVIRSFFRRVIIGIPVVGAASVVHLLWSVSMLGPFHYLTQFRGRNRRDSSRDIATILILIAIIFGALRALRGVYRMTERWAKYILLRTEDAILEVR